MEDNLKNRIACVIDFGSYISVAQRLSRDFGKVYYYNPWCINGYPNHNAVDIGRNVEGVIKVSDWEDIFEETDIFIFPDVYFAGLQSLLKRLGKRVYGSGKGQLMETDRGGMKNLQRSLDLPLNEYKEVTGLYELEDELREVDDKYIKSGLRGDMESFHHENHTLSKEELKALKHQMGVYDKKEKYIIESPIDALAEIGIDTMVCDGKYLAQSTTGMEIKDSLYIGKITKYDNLPAQVRDVTDKLASVFESYGYRGAYANEIRVEKKNKQGFLIDQTCRMGQPNTDLIMEQYDNYSEMIWMIAEGELPEVKYTYKWGCQAVIKSEKARDESVAIQFPKEYARYIKIKNLVVDDDGVHYYTKNGIEMCEIGSVVGLGNTMEEAIAMAQKIASTIKGFDLKIDLECAKEVREQMASLKAAGIKYI